MTAKKYNQREYRAYNEGYDCIEALLDGAPRENNPYRLGSALHAAWKDGWDEGLDFNRAVLKREADARQEFHL